MFDIFARGFLMDAAGDGGGGGGVAVAEPSSDFGGGGESSVDTTTGREVHDAEFVDTPEPQTTEPEPEPAQETGLVKAGEHAVQNGRITGSGRAALEAVKAISPRLQQELIQGALMHEWFRREFPGGKREVQQLRQLVQDLQGEQGIAELRAVAEGHDALDAKYIAGDPSFIDEITFSPEGQQGFVRVMPAALRRFAELAPEHFAHENAKNFAAFMDQARLPVTFARMADLLNRATAYEKSGNHEIAASLLTEITQSYNEIAEVLDKVYTSSKTPPAALKGNDNPALDDRARQLSEREKGLQRQEWGFSVSQERKRLFSKSWTDLTKGRNLNSDQDQTIKGFYELRMSAKIRNWQNQADRFIANGDKDGYLREQFAFFQRAIPEALRQAIQQALPAKPGPKGSASTAKTATNVPRSTTPNLKGAVRVARMPPTSDLDAIKTTGEMLSRNQAYRKDGTLVQWA